MNKWRKNKGLKLYRAIAQDDDNEVIVHFEMPEESSGSWSSGCSNSDYLTTMPPFEDGWENSLVIAE